jgi:NADH-quinone oxidoreductase subunit G
MPKLTVDGTEILVPAGATVLQACELDGKEIPRCFWQRYCADWLDVAVALGGE